MSPHDALYRTTCASFEALVAEYNAQRLGTPEHVQRRLSAILTADSPAQAQERARKALDVGHMALLAAQARGRILGVVNEHNVEQKARDAEGLADMLDRKGLAEQADGQRKRAERIRAQAPRKPR